MMLSNDGNAVVVTLYCHSYNLVTLHRSVSHETERRYHSKKTLTCMQTCLQASMQACKHNLLTGRGKKNRLLNRPRERTKKPSSCSMIRPAFQCRGGMCVEWSRGVELRRELHVQRTSVAGALHSLSYVCLSMRYTCRGACPGRSVASRRIRWRAGEQSCRPERPSCLEGTTGVMNSRAASGPV